LLNAETGKQVRTGSCRRIGVNAWGRIDWIIDLTDLRHPGQYLLEVSIDQGEAFRSAAFEISESCYDVLLEKAARHLYLARCGIFCHGHDADLRSVTQKHFGRLLGHQDVSGGWHDAHDDNKWIGNVWNVIYGLCDVHERLRPPWRNGNEPLPCPLAEAWWEVEFLLKAQKPDGSFYFGVFEWYPERVNGRWVNRIHTERNCYDDLAKDRRVLLDVWDPRQRAELLGWDTLPPAIEDGFAGYQDHAYLAAAIARFGRLVAAYDRRISNRCLRAARATLNFLSRSRCPRSHFLNSQSGLALAKIELFLHKPTPQLARQIDAHLKEVLALQQPEGYFRSAAGCLGLEIEAIETREPWYVSSFPYSYMIALVRYLSSIPRGALRTEVQESLRRFVEMARSFTQYTSFEQLVEIQPFKPPLIIRRGSSGAHCLSIASVFLAASRILGQTKLRAIGEKNIQWMFGANPRAMSFMVDEGYRNIGQYAATHNGFAKHGFAYYNHNRDSRWGMSSGIRGSVADISNQPDNYPNAGDSMYHRYQHHGQEDWLLITGWFLLAGVEMVCTLNEPARR
jgi:hypothetical protein